jgi:protein-S-isoprenylcysteine O-methyltransferase Ste14
MDNNIPRIIPPVYFLMTLIVMILLNSYAPIERLLQYPWRYFGILVIVSGFVLILISGNLFRKLGTPRRPGLKATMLVTSGAFRFTRNPMYLGMIVILVGVAILLGSVSPVIIIPFMVWILHSQFILREEKWMEGWFGESYIEYKKKTPRWI